MGGKDNLNRGAPIEQYRTKIGRNYNKNVRESMPSKRATQSISHILTYIHTNIHT